MRNTNFGGLCGQMMRIKDNSFLLFCNNKLFPITSSEKVTGEEGQTVYIITHLEVDDNFKISIVADKIHYGYEPEIRLPYKD